MANKIDIPTALSPEDVEIRLRAKKILKGYSYKICKTNITDGIGLSNSLEWLFQQIKTRMNREYNPIYWVFGLIGINVNKTSQQNDYQYQKI